MSKIMDDEEVIASGATSYQIACILSTAIQLLHSQPERLNKKTPSGDAIV